jgi:hypothetical protein
LECGAGKENGGQLAFVKLKKGGVG